MSAKQLLGVLLAVAGVVHMEGDAINGEGAALGPDAASPQTATAHTRELLPVKWTVK